MIVSSNPVITERYARAFFSLARSQNLTAELGEQAEGLIPLFAPGAPLVRFLEGPQIPTEAKQDLLKKVFAGQVHPLMGNLFRLLVEKGRLEFFDPILRRFRELIEQEQGIFEAQVATATELAADEKQRLQEVLERFTRARLRIDFVVDARLIGGVRFIYGDVLIDDTVSGKLHRLRQQLYEAAQE